MKFLRLYDTVGLPPVTPAAANLAAIRAGTNKQLLVRIAATHAARMTGNFTFYPPQKVKRAARTFLVPYAKPVLVNHDMDLDPIGRVAAAEYRDLSEPLLVRYDRLASLLRDDIEPNSAFELVDLLWHDLTQPDFPGLGYVELVARIADPSAIEKVIDGRYQTVSVGMMTRSATCSICRTDWVQDGICDHRPGRTYDDKLCFLVTGDIRYDEVSFVNRPADSMAGIIEIIGSNTVQQRVDLDAEVRPQYATLFDVFISEPGLLINLADQEGRNLYSLRPALREIQFLMKANANANLHQLSAQSAKVMDKLLRDSSLEISSLADKQMVVEIHNHLHATYDGNSIDKCPQDVQALHAKLHQAAIDGGFVDALVTGDLDGTLELFSVPDPQSLNLTPTAGEQQQDAQTLTDDLPDIEQILDEEQCYELMAKELDLMAQELRDQNREEEAQKILDAKLTAEQRKRLKSSTFCGPNRSFPVPDCAHVTAARRLIGRYKGPGSKEAILACVNRKAKALGCDKGKDKLQDKQSGCRVCPGVEHRDSLLAKRQELLTRWQAEIKAIDEELRTLYGVEPEEFCERCQERIVALEAAKRAAQVDASQLEALEEDLQAAEAMEEHLRQTLVDVLIGQILLHRQMREMRLYTDAEIDAEKAVLSQRSYEALECTLADLEREAPIKSLLEKRIKGMSNNPVIGAMPDPTLSQNDNLQSDEQNADKHLLNRIMQRYNQIDALYGRNAAQQYLTDMQKIYPSLMNKQGGVSK